GEAAPVRVQLEHRAVEAAAAVESRAVERAVSPQHQPAIGVCAGGGIVEVLEHCEAGPVRVQLEHGAAAAGAAVNGRPVERAIRTLNYPGKWVSAGGIVEAVEHAEAGPV